MSEVLDFSKFKEERDQQQRASDMSEAERIKPPELSEIEGIKIEKIQEAMELLGFMYTTARVKNNGVEIDGISQGKDGKKITIKIIREAN